MKEAIILITLVISGLWELFKLATVAAVGIYAMRAIGWL